MYRYYRLCRTGGKGICDRFTKLLVQIDQLAGACCVLVAQFVFVLLMRCRRNGPEQIQVNTEFPGLTVVSSMDGGRTWTEYPVGASRRNTTLILATRFVLFSLLQQLRLTTFSCYKQ